MSDYRPLLYKIQSKKKVTTCYLAKGRFFKLTLADIADMCMTVPCFSVTTGCLKAQTGYVTTTQDTEVKAADDVTCS